MNTERGPALAIPPGDRDTLKMTYSNGQLTMMFVVKYGNEMHRVPTSSRSVDSIEPPEAIIIDQVLSQV